MKNRSLFHRQMVSHIAVILFMALSLSGSVLFFSYKGKFLDRKNELTRRLTNVASIFANQLNAGQIPNRYEWNLASSVSNARIWLEDSRGRLLGGVPPSNWECIGYKIKSFHLPISQVYFSPKIKDPIIIISVPVRIKNQPGVIIGYYVFDKSFYLLLNAVLRYYVFPFTVGLLVAIFLGVILARNIARSVADIAGAAARFSAGDYQSRTQTVGNDEIGTLGNNFNQMADSILHTQATHREFFSNISHDLKTPLSCIKANTEALLDGIAATPDDLRCYLNRILTEVDRMSRLIQHLIETVRIESGKMIIKSEPVDMVALLEREAEKVEILLKAKELVIRTHVDTKHRSIRGDSDQLEQVLDNLLSNAIRYSPMNSAIEISVTEKQGILQIRVVDHGPGIDKDDLPLIWERFYRADKSRNADTGGNGLGLFICRGLVKTMGGEISVQSQKGKGTIFILCFPVIE
jgi:signal transduction histidine kinase